MLTVLIIMKSTLNFPCAFRGPAKKIWKDQKKKKKKKFSVGHLTTFRFRDMIYVLYKVWCIKRVRTNWNAPQIAPTPRRPNLRSDNPSCKIENKRGKGDIAQPSYVQSWPD